LAQDKHYQSENAYFAFLSFLYRIFDFAVCYKESNQEQLEAFTEELKQEGKLTKETETLLKQLEDTKSPEDNETTETESYLVNTQSVYCIWVLKCKGPY
jgi:hypothetical protein